MTIPLPPRKWATDTNFASGPDTGTPTRVDPGAGLSPQGIIPHAGVAAQHVNYLHGETIDYMHGLLESPETYAEIREDFMPGYYDSVNKIVFSEYAWQVSQGSGSDPTAGGSFSSSNPGQLTASVPANQSFEMHLGAELGDAMVTWGELTHATFVFALNSSNFTGGEAFVGLADNISDTGPATDGVGLWMDRATSANWLIRNKAGGVDDAQTTSVPVVSDEFVVMKLLRISATQVRVFLNDNLVATLTDGTTAPADNTMLSLGCYVNAGASASLNPKWDMVYVRWNTASRAT